MEFKTEKPKNILIVHTYCREVAKKAGMFWGGQTDAKLSDFVGKLILEAVSRAKINKRRTIFPQDF